MMSFRKPICMFIIAAAAIVAVGCGSGQESTQNAQQKNTAAATESQTVALPGGSPAFIGKVKDIVGNEVTVYKAEVSQNEAAPKDAPDAQAQAQNQNQNQSGGARMQGNRGFSMKFTEEAQTFIIPVGTPIVTIQRGTGGATPTLAGLTDIKKESILRVWEKDGEVSFVQLMPGAGTAGNRQNTGNNNRQGQGGVFVSPQGIRGGPPPGMGG